MVLQTHIIKVAKKYYARNISGDSVKNLGTPIKSIVRPLMIENYEKHTDEMSKLLEASQEIEKLKKRNNILTEKIHRGCWKV